MAHRILLQAVVGNKPIQHYVHEAGQTVEFRNYMAASLEVARLKRVSKPGTKFTIVSDTKH